MGINPRESQDGLNQFCDLVGNKDTILPLTETEGPTVNTEKEYKFG